MIYYGLPREMITGLNLTTKVRLNGSLSVNPLSPGG